MTTRIIRDGDLTYAAEVIMRGGLVAVPTETVYGLAGSGLDEEAIRRIYEVKGRPAIKPLSLLIPALDSAEEYCEITDAARELAEKHWPGPLTLVLKKRGTVPEIITAGGDTVGLRCPDHPMTLQLLRQCGVPLAAPSANLSDMPSPKTARDVLSYFEGKIECILDGGACAFGVESTVLDVTCKPPRVLRQGALVLDI